MADVVEGGDSRDREAPVVVGAAGEPRNRERLPGFAFPADAQIDPRSATVVKVTTASGDGSGSVGSLAGVYAEEQGPTRPRRGDWVWIAVLATLVVAAVAAVGLTYAWARTQYFVGNEGGYVAIYRGLPGELGPLALHSVEQVTTLTVDSLPDFEASQVEGTIPVDSLAVGAADRAAPHRARRAVHRSAEPPPAARPRAAPTPARRLRPRASAREPPRCPARQARRERSRAGPGRAPLPPAHAARAEAALFVLAFAIGAAAYVQVDLAILGRLASDTVPVLLAVAALLLVAHLAIRFLATYADPIIVPTVATLNFLGLAMIHRLDLAEVQRAARNGSTAPSPDVYTQLTWTALGVLLFIAVLLVVKDHRGLQRYTYTAMFAGLVLLLLPLVPVIGAEINGARLWLRLGGLSFQPGEIAKILLTIFFAGYLTVTRDSLALVRTKVMGLEFPRGRDMGPLFVAWFVSLGVLVFERDLGTSLLFFGLFVSLLYIATQRRSWLVLGAVLFITGAVFAYLAFGHVRLRVDVWLHPFGDEANTSYQIAQSLYGFASGGMFGSGLGQGYPQLVPYAKSDFIIAAFGEELGLIGLMAMLVLYGIVVERGMRTAIACRDVFGTLLAAGLSISLGLQVFVVVGGVSRLIPLTGLTTPFLAQGGSSLVANWIAIGLLMRVSDAARRPDTESVSLEDAPTQVVSL